jgi:hypothetical protein
LSRVICASRSHAGGIRNTVREVDRRAIARAGTGETIALRPIVLNPIGDGRRDGNGDRWPVSVPEFRHRSVPIAQPRYRSTSDRGARRLREGDAAIAQNGGRRPIPSRRAGHPAVDRERTEGDVERSLLDESRFRFVQQDRRFQNMTADALFRSVDTRSWEPLA